MKTKKLVKNYARENNFRPNPYARTLRSGNSKLIGVVLSEHEVSFYTTVLLHIEPVLSNLGYIMIVRYSRSNESSELHCIDSLISLGVEGLIIISELSNSTIARLRFMIDKGFPVILLGSNYHQLGTFHVNIDIENFIDTSLKKMHLYGKKLVVVTCEDSKSNNNIMTNCNSIFKRYGIRFVNKQILFCENIDLTDCSNYLIKEIQDWIKKNGDIQGIIATSENLTRSCIKAISSLENKGRRIEIIGISDNEFCDSITDDITIIPPPSKAIGEVTVTMLLKMLNGNLEMTFENILIEV